MALKAPGWRLALPIVVFALGLVALGGAAWLTLAPQAQQTAGSSVGGPFSLVDQEGRAVTDRDFRGAPKLVFFGFTHCPDVCPTALQQASEVLRALGPKGDRLRFLFVTIDPERDTAAVLKDYLGSFDPRIVGLTGTPEQVSAAVKAYRAYARKVPLKDGDYTMEHTSLVYLMDGDNRFIGSFNLARPPEAAAAELARSL
jgi:protein SCO1